MANRGIWTSRTGRIVASAAALLLIGVLGAASTAAVPRVVAADVPPATGNNAVINVKVGADRVGTNGVSNLAGVTLRLYNGTTAPTTPVTDAWATCVSDADGDCSFVVPNTQTSAINTCTGITSGANCDRRFWVVQVGAPEGFSVNSSFRTGNGDGTGSQTTAYEFRTGSTLRAGNTYSSTSDFMIATGNSNRSASGGVWQQSRINPAPAQSCGLDVAVVQDLSGSVTSAQLEDLKAATDTFADSLVGTPSRLALFSFSNVSPASGATQNYPGLTSVATQQGADAFKARYQSWTSGGGTNWDRGLAAAAEAAPNYDLVVVITDGNPTFYSQPQQGPGNFSRIREMENGVFSANALKAQDTRVLAVGVGAGVSNPATAQNLRAISGPTAYDGSNADTADYFQVANYDAVGAALRQLALGDCEDTLSVIKQIVGPDGDITNATPGGAGWTFDAATTTPGVTLPTTSATTDATSGVNFPITFGGGVTTGAITVNETEQEGESLFPVDGFNGVCRNLATDEAIPVTNSGATGFTVDVPSSAPVSCIVYNQAVAPASITVDKEWVINGAAPVPDGNQPGGLTAQLTLTGPDGAPASDQDWGVTRPGYSQGDTVTVDEDVVIAESTIDPDLCTISEPAIVEVNGAEVAPIPIPDGSDRTLTAGANTLTIRNTVDCESRLTLAKNVVGTEPPTSWNLSALPAPDEPAGQLPGPSGTAGSEAVTDQVVTALVPYQLAEAGGPPTYVQNDVRSTDTYPLSTGSWACIRIDADGEQVAGFGDGLNGAVTVPFGERVQCTATNQTGRLRLIKEVVNDGSGTAEPGDFTLSATPGDDPPVEGLETYSGPGSTDGTTYEVRPGHPYELSETGVPGYTLVAVNCESDGESSDLRTVTVGAGETVVCTFVNDDDPAQLTLRKQVETGTTGATDAPADWTLTATPDEITGQDPVSGNGENGVTDEAVISGTYDLSEDGPAGYDAGDWTCEGDGGTLEGTSLTLANGADVTCTITNTAQQPTLTLVKDVVNNAGGTAEPTDWTLSADGPTPLSGTTGTDAVTGRAVEVGSYALSESGGPAGYGASDWVCISPDGPVPVVDGSVSVGLGQDLTCTITNDDAPAELTLVKEVVNDNGGTAEATEWTLTADGPTSISGATGSEAVTGATVEAGTYDLSEAGPGGYTASDWTCTGATLEGTTVTVANGADATCTITNDDQPATLTLVKEVVNDNGGTAVPTDWTLTAEGPTLISGTTGSEAVTGATVDAGAYDLTEAGLQGGYVPGDWSCTGATLEGITVAVPNGADVTCTITNDDRPATLTLVKEVVNDNGGTAEPTAWTLTADGPTPISGASGSETVTGAAVDAGAYDLSEADGPAGYTASDWTCTGATLEGTTVTVANGADVSCTITNDDQPATLTLVKEVVNDNGGTVEADAWTLTAEGPTLITGTTGSEAVTGASVDAGAYDLTEAGGPAGYLPGGWSCRGGDLEGITVTVPNGADVTCTITNDDQPGKLTLVKEVVNDNGGTAEATDWTLSADGPTPITGRTGEDAVTAVEVDAGESDLSEADGPDGYDASDWDCPGATVAGTTVTVANGADVTCTITNDDRPPTLTLVKEVINDNGGTAEATEWTLSAVGPTTIEGATGSEAVTGATVSPGDYALDETGGPASGYTASDWTCRTPLTEVPLTDGSVSVSVSLGQDVTCTITNDDQAATLTLLKEVVNDNGGTAEATEWTLSADGPTPITGATGTEAVTGAPVDAGSYELSESDGPAGYGASDWVCISPDGAVPVVGGSVSVSLGQDLTCTITNDDRATPTPPTPTPPTPPGPISPDGDTNPAGPWYGNLPSAGGPAGWITAVALLLLAAGAYLIARRRSEDEGAGN
ncbi:prealbumin-like fold domain-containing protein [Aeromicrobium duanguangcaii]|uniref:prealbumin-like fold domain-containing protein n=1 Tax=Aeromicrobium duanguangcaii TaxID=2968086 RepID=UPI002017CE8E|nr:VWA domain-containing protein [Aeromicrobium duanguangcaii]MCL3838415.1 VWA domain-containing protein [Aeromicrobium duanguangcaii]